MPIRKGANGLLSDLELIENIREGDLSAFETLVLAHQDRVYGLCLRMCGNREDAFDLSQEIFLRVFRSLKNFKGDSTFSTWLYRLSTNVCLDHLRRTLKRRAILQMELNAAELAECTDDRFAPEKAWDHIELRESIAQALTQLTPEHRAIIILRDIHQLSYIQISEVLDCGEGTVKSRLFRAREALRKVISREGNLLKKPTSKKDGRGLAP